MLIATETWEGLMHANVTLMTESAYSNVTGQWSPEHVIMPGRVIALLQSPALRVEEMTDDTTMTLRFYNQRFGGFHAYTVTILTEDEAALNRLREQYSKISPIGTPAVPRFEDHPVYGRVENVTL